jgi:hypothetical protein
VGTEVSFPWVKEVGCKSSAEVKKEWSYTSTPPVCLHGMHRDNFTFLLYYISALYVKCKKKKKKSVGTLLFPQEYTVHSPLPQQFLRCPQQHG